MRLEDGRGGRFLVWLQREVLRESGCFVLVFGCFEDIFFESRNLFYEGCCLMGRRRSYGRSEWLRNRDQAAQEGGITSVDIDFWKF